MCNHERQVYKRGQVAGPGSEYKIKNEKQFNLGWMRTMLHTALEAKVTSLTVTAQVVPSVPSPTALPSLCQLVAVFQVLRLAMLSPARAFTHLSPISLLSLSRLTLWISVEASLPLRSLP